MNSNRHPVMDVYDEYRTARLNVHYYGKQLKRLRISNFWIELALALTISSGVVNLWFWESAVGGYVWKILLAIVAVIAIIKPLIKLPDKIQRKSELLSSWRTLDYELQKLVLKISQYKKYDENFRDDFLALLEIKGSIVKVESPEDIDNMLNEKCYKQVNNELPIDSFYIPEGK